MKLPIKNTLFVTLTFGLLLANVGCAKQREVFPRAATQIELQSGTLSKDPAASAAEFEVQIGGWEGSNVNVDWNTNPSWLSTSQVLGNTNPSNMILSPVRSYDYSGQATTVRAWAPAGTVNGGRVEFPNPSGEVDVMLATSVWGSSQTPIHSPLIFSHLTTKLQFVAVNFIGADDQYITSMVVRGVKLPTGIELATDRLVFAGVIDLPVSGIPAQGVQPTVGGSALGRPVLFVPTDTNELRVDITTTKRSYYNVLVTTADHHFLAGRSYVVTLTFNRTSGEQIEATSTIAPWSEGQSAGGEVL